MLEPPLPSNEVDRGASLHRLGILDTAPEERFDRITRFAAKLFKVPAAAVSLVDTDRQWLKSSVGLELVDVSRSAAFCSYAIVEDEPLVVPDALLDERFEDNPLVVEAPHIRFYAGCPISDEAGYKLGTLCLIDFRPRALSAKDVATLKELATWAETELLANSRGHLLRQYQEALIRSERISEALTDGQVIIDGAGKISSFNAAAEQIFGYRREQVLGKNVKILMPEAVSREHDGYLRRYAATREGRVMGSTREMVGRRRDGTEFPVDLSVNCVVSGGEPLYVGIVRDITERKRAEEALRLSRERYRALSELAPIGIFRTDASGAYVFVNQGWSEITGLPREKALGAGWTAALHPDDAEETLAAWRAASGTDTEFNREFRFCDPEGRSIWVVARAIPQATESGHPTGHLGTIQDLTDRRVTEEALRVSEEIHRSVIAVMNEGILIQDRTGVVIGCNAAAERILGVSVGHVGMISEELSGQAIREDGTPFPPAEYPATQALRTGRPQSNTVMGVPRGDGQMRWVSINSHPLIRDGMTEPWGVSCTFADITDRRVVDRMKSEFVSVVSHELRTPLTSIRGALGLLASGAMGPLSERPQHMLDIAVTNTDRLIRMVNDILDIERIESSAVPMVKTTCDAAELIGQAVEMMRPIADKAHVNLVAETVSTKLWVDPDRIIQTLTNLLSNAIKFSPPDSEVRVGSSVDLESVTFEVADQGRGLPPDKLGSIFERFQQVDASDSRDKGGTGLGLAICRSIVDQHGGHIWAESTLGEGTRFAFSLPVGGPRIPHSRRVVVLGDEVDAELYAEVGVFGDQHGCEVIRTTSVMETLAAISDSRPDAVVLSLDRITGTEPEQESALVELRNALTSREIPLIAVGSDRPEGFGASTRWVPRPFSPRALVEVLAEVVTVDSADRVLLVEDDPDLGGVLQQVFEQRGIMASLATTLGTARSMLCQFRPSLVLLDIALPDGSGLAFAETLLDDDPEDVPPIVVYTAGDLSSDDRERFRRHHVQFHTKSRVPPDVLVGHVAALLANVATDVAAGNAGGAP